MENKPLLSICIPTYNRAKYLDEAIKSVVTQITDDIKDKVEICISDNASTDETDEIVKKWKEKSPVPIMYNKNPVNLGADRNYLKVVEMANGKYCWFLGSDDKIKFGSIEFILGHLTGEIDIFLLNREEFDVRLINKFKDSFFINALDDRIFDFPRDIKEYFSKVNSLAGLFSYISSIIFKKKLWDYAKRDVDLNKLIGTNYIHAALLLYVITHFKSRLKYIVAPLVQCRLGNDSFLRGNLIERMLIDVRGYSLIVSSLSINQYRDCIMKIVYGQWTLKWLLRKKLSNELSVNDYLYLFFLAPFREKIRFLIPIFFSRKILSIIDSIVERKKVGYKKTVKKDKRENRI